MKRQVVLTIEPHEDGKRCGGCGRCFFIDCPPDSVSTAVAMRGPLCLAAEAHYRALVRAGKEEGGECGRLD